MATLIPLPYNNQITMLSHIFKALIPVLFSVACFAQKNKSKTDIQITDNLKAHIQYLADDKLEGRRTGTKGEELASGIYQQSI